MIVSQCGCCRVRTTCAHCSTRRWRAWYAWRPAYEAAPAAATTRGWWSVLPKMSTCGRPSATRQPQFSGKWVTSSGRRLSLFSWLYLGYHVDQMTLIPRNAPHSGILGLLLYYALPIYLVSMFDLFLESLCLCDLSDMLSIMIFMHAFSPEFNSKRHDFNVKLQFGGKCNIFLGSIIIMWSQLVEADVYKRTELFLDYFWVELFSKQNKRLIIIDCFVAMTFWSIWVYL